MKSGVNKSVEQRVIDVIEASDNGHNEPGIVVLSTGVKLKIKTVPQLLLADIVKSFERPKPPVVFIEGKGRTEENPDDPDYQERLANYNNNVGMGINDAFILKGTSLLHCPKEVEPPESDGWIEESILLGIRINSDSTKARYLSWIKHIAAPNDSDIKLIVTEVGRQSGVSEQDVSEAVQRFRRH